MSLIVKEPEGNSKFPPIEPGTYPAVCCGVLDVGEHYSELYDKTSRKVLIMWELPTEIVHTDDGDKPRTISETYSASLGDKASLRKMLESWRGKQFTSDELKGFNVANLLGVGCNINIINIEGKEGKTFAKVQAVTRPLKGSAPITGSLDLVLFDMDARDALKAIENLPEWIQKRIKDSVTYANMTALNGSVEVDEKLPWEN